MESIEYEDFSFQNINSIINYIKNNWLQLLLLILVFIIIYVVDHISNINAVIFAIPSPIPGFSASPISAITQAKGNSNKVKNVLRKQKIIKNYRKL